MGRCEQGRPKDQVLSMPKISSKVLKQVDRGSECEYLKKGGYRFVKFNSTVMIGLVRVLKREGNCHERVVK